MNSIFGNRANGYLASIRKGISAVESFHSGVSCGQGSREDQLERLKGEIENAEAVVIGAGAGLSTAAGLTYSGERFERYFGDFAARFGIRDMYTGGFFPFPDKETRWAWWARHIYYNRYIDTPKPVYEELLDLVKDKDYFVITTNVDHRFQAAGFDKKRLYYTQGDYGLFQSVNPRIQKTYDNEEWVMKAMEAQGFVRDENGVFQVPADGELKMQIPAELIPKCPDDGSDMTMNLRADDTFVQDEGWYAASERYSDFLRRHTNMKTLFLDAGTGFNTPIIFKVPFWQMTESWPDATYACLNYGQAFAPDEIKSKSICINGDLGDILSQLK